MSLVTPVAEDQPTFANVDRCSSIDQLDAAFAILGVPHGIPYPYATSDAPTPATGPASIRKHSARYGRFFENHDFDLDGPVMGNSDLRIVDCGDVVGEEAGSDENHLRTADVIRTIVRQGAIPMVLGGDDSIPIGAMRGLDALKDVHLVQFDAHLDFRDEAYGVGDGWSSSIRRASEMDHIGSITQIGLRGAGSASVQDVADARDNGNTFITAKTIHEHGVESIIDDLPEGDLVYIAFDVDVMDPSIAPGVASTAFGGLTYWQATALLEELARRNTIVGANFAEVNEAFDPRGLTPTLTARLILNLIGTIARTQSAGDRA